MFMCGACTGSLQSQCLFGVDAIAEHLVQKIRDGFLQEPKMTGLVRLDQCVGSRKWQYTFCQIKSLLLCTRSGECGQCAMHWTLLDLKRPRPSRWSGGPSKQHKLTCSRD